MAADPLTSFLKSFVLDGDDGQLYQILQKVRGGLEDEPGASGLLLDTVAGMAANLAEDRQSRFSKLFLFAVLDHLRKVLLFEVEAPENQRRYHVELLGLCNQEYREHAEIRRVALVES